MFLLLILVLAGLVLLGKMSLVVALVSLFAGYALYVALMFGIVFFLDRKTRRGW